MTDTAEALSYPIGRHQPQATYSPAERDGLIARLAAQPAALAAAVRNFREEDYERPYRPHGWTVRQLTHHVADSHLHMFIRVKFALADDHPTIMPYGEDAWVHQADVREVPPAVSIALFAALHERAVALFRSLTDAEFARTLLHPDNGPMRVVDVLAMYAWHGDHHVAHILRMRDRDRDGDHKGEGVREA